MIYKRFYEYRHEQSVYAGTNALVTFNDLGWKKVKLNQVYVSASGMLKIVLYDGEEPFLTSFTNQSNLNSAIEFSPSYVVKNELSIRVWNKDGPPQDIYIVVSGKAKW